MTLAPADDVGHGVDAHLAFQAGYAYKRRKNLPSQFRLGEGLVGQCALEKKRILVSDVPTDYVRIASGLGEAKPSAHIETAAHTFSITNV